LVYKNDPPGIELLQSFPSLMNDNYWGIPGAGDCDCFTIAALACAAARSIPARAVIVGNSSQAPTHVYCQYLVDGRWIDFDLVSSDYGTTKPYKYKQTLKLH
jgi:transglutaminase-like putative cysteine protease